ncbi:MAG TPA: hypothetical protein VF344_00005, partial [Candidatus Limnocylindrales bacterium]
MIRSLIAKARESEYVRVGATLQFRAVQRRRMRVAARVGMLVIAAADTFDALSTLDLDLNGARLIVALDLTVVGVALVGWWLLGGPLRRHPEIVAWVATIGIGISTVITGALVPSLAAQTIGYLLLIPVLVALLLPWRTRTHAYWVMAYAVVGLTYLTVGDLGHLSVDGPGDLIVAFLIALGGSLIGHVLLHR